MPTVDTIATFFESELSSIRQQSAWDFSGKQVYLGNANVTKLCLALDPTKSVIEQAINRGCELLITHHPLFFTPQKGINISNSKDELIIKAIKNDLSILSYHTNLDMAAEGLNTHIVRLMGAELAGRLDTEGEVEYSAMFVYVPIDYQIKLIDALAAAGAGKFGKYDRCAFYANGTGTFTPSEGAKPFIGTLDKAEFTPEVRIDMLIPNSNINKAILAIKESHPYEEPAYYIVPTRSPETYGFGRIGQLSGAVSFDDFVSLLKKKLGIKHIGTNMPDYSKSISKFAVVTGSGASEWRECLKHNIDILVTGDMKHHDALDAREAGICILDAGHFATEKIYMNSLAEILEKRFKIETVIAEETSTVNII